MIEVSGAYSFFILLLVALMGGAFQWLVMWGKGETDLGFSAYLRKNRKYTVSSLAVIVTGVATMYSTGDVVFSGQTIATCFLSGFTIDRMLNKAD